jgi:hypothetical protein
VASGRSNVWSIIAASSARVVGTAGSGGLTGAGGYTRAPDASAALAG